MTPAEILRAATDAGMTFAIEGSKLRVRGGTAESRAELAPLIGPVAAEIAGLLRKAACTGMGDRRPCPAHGYVHGNLSDREPCSSCGREDWILSIVDARGVGRTCSRCVRASNARTPRCAQAAQPGRAS